VEDEVAAETPICNFGEPAKPFDLKGVDGKRHTLESVRGPKGVLVMFICNHCPYVKAVLDRISRDVSELKEHGIGAIAINANDPTTLDLQDAVSEDVQDLRPAPVRDPTHFGPVQVDVAVQPEKGLVAVYQIEERLEAYVRLILGVAESCSAYR
jgi:thiol-disulfide isomerase/thioredoxin